MYNVNSYNVPMYNADTHILGLTESLTSADAISGKELQRLAYESVPLIDNMLRFFNQVDEMGLDYLTTTDEADLEVIKGLLDSISTGDSPVVVSFIKVLLETMPLADVAAFVYSTTKSEAMLLSDNVTKNISNKGLSERMLLQDWIRLTKTGDVWGD